MDALVRHDYAALGQDQLDISQTEAEHVVETAIGRYKHLVGSTLRARNLAAQQGEVAIAVRALNRMIGIAKPLSVRVT